MRVISVGMERIMMGMWGIRVGMRRMIGMHGIMVAMRGMRGMMEMRGIRVGMQEIAVEKLK